MLIWDFGKGGWLPGREVALREYDMVSPENACKMDATEPGRFASY